MCRIELGIDKVADRHGRCVGSRLDLLGAAVYGSRNELLVHAADTLAGGASQRKGKLFLPLTVSGSSSLVLSQALAKLSKRLRQNVVIEIHAGVEGLSPEKIACLRGLRNLQKVNLALSSTGYEWSAFKKDIKALDPEFVIVEDKLIAEMIATRNRANLIDLSEVCAKRGTRVVVNGQYCDANQMWLMDAGVDMFMGYRFTARISCPELDAADVMRRISREENGELDGVMAKMGVRTALTVG